MKKGLWKTIIGMLVVAIMLSGTLVPAVALADEGYSPTEKAAMAAESTNSSAAVVSNGIYNLIVRDALYDSGVGTYTVATGAAHPNPGEDVFYCGSHQNPWTTYLTVRDYDTKIDYVSTTHYVSTCCGFTVKHLDDYSPMVTVAGNEITTVWDVDGLVIEQVTEILGSTLADSKVKVQTTVATKAGEAPHDIGIRYLWDIKIDGDDDTYYAPRNPDGAWLHAEEEWVDPAFESGEMVNNVSSPMFNIYGTVTGPASFSPAPTAPDLLQYARWQKAFTNAFNYAITPGAESYDSALVYYWGNTLANSIPVAGNGGTESVVAYLFLPQTQQNSAPDACPVSVSSTSSLTPTIHWTYSDPDADPQSAYEVEVNTGAGGVGTSMLATSGTGTAQSMVYAGTALTHGETYYARVRVNDGSLWSAWCEGLWTVADLPVLVLTPPTATNILPGDNTHTVTATVTVNGSPQVGETVDFEVTAGPNTGTAGSATTDVNGEATWTYTGSAVGTDTIVATATVVGATVSDTASKTWENAPPITPIPGANGWSIGALMLILGATAMIVLRRRQSFVEVK